MKMSGLVVQVRSRRRRSLAKKTKVLYVYVHKGCEVYARSRKSRLLLMLLHTASKSWFVHQSALHQTYCLVPEFTVHSHVDAKVADMMYVVEITEPRTFDEPLRMRLVNNIADHVIHHDGQQLTQ